MVPVPVRLMDCGVVGSESLIVMAATREPRALGLKATDMAQLQLKRTLEPQGSPLGRPLVKMKSLALVPVIVMLVIFNVPVSLFSRIPSWGGLVVPTVC